MGRWPEMDEQISYDLIVNIIITLIIVIIIIIIVIIIIINANDTMNSISLPLSRNCRMTSHRMSLF